MLVHGCRVSCFQESEMDKKMVWIHMGIVWKQQSGTHRMRCVPDWRLFYDVIG